MDKRDVKAQAIFRSLPEKQKLVVLMLLASVVKFKLDPQDFIGGLDAFGHIMEVGCENLDAMNDLQRFENEGGFIPPPSTLN